MTDYFASIPILLNGRQIFVQFSNHQELKTDPNNANNQQAQAALQSATLLQDIGRTGGQNCVLRVVVNNLIYPVNVETFHQVGNEMHRLKDESATRSLTFIGEDFQQIRSGSEDNHLHQER